MLLTIAKSPRYSLEGELRLERTNHPVGHANTFRFDFMDHDKAPLNTSG